MKLYKYFFYRLYKRQHTKFSEIESLIFALITMTTIVFLNIVTIDIFLAKLFSLTTIIDSIFSVVIVMAIIFGINCCLFLVNKNYKKFEERFRNESKIQNTWGTLWIIAYIIFSFILFFISVNFK